MEGKLQDPLTVAPGADPIKNDFIAVRPGIIIKSNVAKLKQLLRNLISIVFASNTFSRLNSLPFPEL